MAKSSINLGTTINDGTGDTLRAAGQKINNNFSEIYTTLGDGSTLAVATVATTGSYNDLSNKPTIPTFDQDLNTTDSVTFANVSIPGNLSITAGMNFDVEVALNAFAGMSVSNGLFLENGASIKDTATNSIAFGGGAGDTSQGASAVALGEGAGNNTQGNQAIAVGRGSGNYQQGVGAVGIGFCAGATTQGDYSVAIGFKAARGNMDNDGTPNQPANSIMINASSTPLNGDQAGLYINPVREDTGNTTKAVYYNTTTKELTYANPTGGSGSSADSLLSDNTNITISIDNAGTPGNTLIWTFGTDDLLALPKGGYVGDIFGENMIGIQANPNDSNSYASLVSHDRQNAIDANSNGVTILTDDSFQGGTTSRTWEFDRSGNLTFPDSTVQTTAYTGKQVTWTRFYFDNSSSGKPTGTISNSNNLGWNYGTMTEMIAGAVNSVTPTTGSSYGPTLSGITFNSSGEFELPAGVYVIDCSFMMAITTNANAFFPFMLYGQSGSAQNWAGEVDYTLAMPSTSSIETEFGINMTGTFIFEDTTASNNICYVLLSSSGAAVNQNFYPKYGFINFRKIG